LHSPLPWERRRRGCGPEGGRLNRCKGERDLEGD